MKTKIVKMAIACSFCFAASESWSAPLSGEETLQIVQTTEKNLPVRDDGDRILPTIRIRTGEMFNFCLPGPNWQYQPRPGLLMLNERLEGGNKWYEFRVDEWSHGDQFVLIFNRSDGFQLRYLIVCGDEDEDLGQMDLADGIKLASTE